MPITPRQLERRRDFIGASDVYRILFAGQACDVWAEKCFDITRPDKLWYWLGRAAEPTLLQWAFDELETTGRMNQRRVAKATDVPLAANCDGITREQQPVEAKICVFGWGEHDVSRQFGEPGTGDVPLSFWCQVQAQLHCIGPDAVVGHVAAMLRGRDEPGLWTIQRDAETFGAMLDMLARFWRDHVVTKRPPLDWPGAPDLDTFRSIQRVPDKTIELPAAAATLAVTMESRRQMRLEAAKWEDESKARLLALLGDASVGTVGGREIVRVETIKRKAYTVKESEYQKVKVTLDDERDVPRIDADGRDPTNHPRRNGQPDRHCEAIPA